MPKLLQDKKLNAQERPGIKTTPTGTKSYVDSCAHLATRAFSNRLESVKNRRKSLVYIGLILKIDFKPAPAAKLLDRAGFMGYSEEQVIRKRSAA